MRRIRTGWYAAGPQSIVEDAVRRGGALGCVSALNVHGAWTLPDTRIHVVVGRGSKTLAGTCTHWSDRVPLEAVEEIPAAIAQTIRCVDLEAAVVALDSVVNRGLISSYEVEAICQKFARGLRLLPHLDPRSESGIETLARLRLRRRNLRVRTQVRIGSARVDLIVGDRLVIELDGRSWHDRPGDFENDRKRDRTLVAAGYLVLRASYSQVMTEWSVIEEQILQIIRRGDHRWRGALRRQS
jgi:very-short-patch-repair endonuclease